MSSHIQALLNRRAAVWEKAKAVLDAAGDKALTGEQRGAFDGYNADIDLIDADIRGFKERESRSALAADAARDLESQGIDPDAKPNKASLDRDTFRQFIAGERKSIEFDMAEHRANELTVSTTGSSTGGQTVFTTFVNRLIEYMVVNSAVLQAVGPNIIRTNSGEAMTFPRVSAITSVATIIGENSALTNQRPAFDQVSIGAYKYGFLRQISPELVTDSAINILDFLAKDAGRAMGNGLGVHLVSGNGTTAPQGVLTAATLGNTGPASVVGGFGTQATAGQGGDLLIDLMHSVIQPYRVNGAWLLHDTTVGSLRKLKTSYGEYIWEPGTILGAPDRILGYPVYTDPNMPTVALAAKSVLFGDFSTYAVRLAGPVRYERSDDYAFANDMITYRSIMRADAKQLDTTGAIKYFQGNAA